MTEQQEFLKALEEFTVAAGYLNSCWTDSIDNDMSGRVTLRYPFPASFNFIQEAINRWNDAVQNGINEPAEMG